MRSRASSCSFRRCRRSAKRGSNGWRAGCAAASLRQKEGGPRVDPARQRGCRAPRVDRDHSAQQRGCGALRVDLALTEVTWLVSAGVPAQGRDWRNVTTLGLRDGPSQNTVGAALQQVLREGHDCMLLRDGCRCERRRLQRRASRTRAAGARSRGCEARSDGPSSTCCGGGRAGNLLGELRTVTVVTFLQSRPCAGTPAETNHVTSVSARSTRSARQPRCCAESPIAHTGARCTCCSAAPTVFWLGPSRRPRVVTFLKSRPCAGTPAETNRATSVSARSTRGARQPRCGAE